MTIAETAYDDLLCSIFNLILKKGLKGLTMDSVAESLSMSKRTLYEIFVSKSDMVLKTMRHMNNKRWDISEKVFREAPNVLVGIIQLFLIQRDFMCNINVSFFADMDRLYPEVKKNYEEEAQTDLDLAMRAFKRGVKEGVLRDDIDYPTQLRMVGLQMESLKRMEEHFPKDVSLIEAYDSIYTIFLRGIVSPKGMEILEDVAKNISDYKEQIKKYKYKNEIDS